MTTVDVAEAMTEYRVARDLFAHAPGDETLRQLIDAKNALQHALNIDTLAAFKLVAPDVLRRSEARLEKARGGA